jgi:hypothetical protein
MVHIQADRLRHQHFSFFVAFLIAATSCQRSQLATTTRHNHNGRVSYSNNHPLGTGKSSTIKTVRINSKKTDNQSNAPGELKTDHDPGSLKTEHIRSGDNENLIASASPEPVVLQPRRYKAESISKTGQFSSKPTPVGRASSIADTNAVNTEKRNGTHDTSLPDTRKNEKWGVTGFILSIVGLVPVFGLPFAVIGVILGAVSLGRIRRNPELYKGKFFAIASLVLGIIGIAAFFAEVAAFFIGMSQPM